MNVKIAFINSHLAEEFYMTHLGGCEVKVQESKDCKLLKYLYGLK